MVCWRGPGNDDFLRRGVSIQWGRDDPTMEPPPRVRERGKKNLFHKEEGFLEGSLRRNNESRSSTVAPRWGKGRRDAVEVKGNEEKEKGERAKREGEKKKETCDNLIVVVSRIRGKVVSSSPCANIQQSRTFLSFAPPSSSPIFLSPPRLRFVRSSVRHPSLGGQKAVKAIKVPESSTREREKERKARWKGLRVPSLPGISPPLPFFLLPPLPSSAARGGWEEGEGVLGYCEPRSGIAPGNCTGI